jgi:hypothetical protein
MTFCFNGKVAFVPFVINQKLNSDSLWTMIIPAVREKKAVANVFVGFYALGVTMSLA